MLTGTATSFTTSPDGSVDPAETATAFLASLTGKPSLLLAVSGGGDSTAMLHAFAEAAKRTGKHKVTLRVATVDHRLRPEAADEARQVGDWCRQLGISHETLVWSSDKPATGLQAAARQARYRLLADAARRHDCSAVLVAHTREDQRETVLMRSARTAHDDAPGLAGMAPAVLHEGDVWFLRPFLDITRSDLRRWLCTRGHGWIDDPGNDDPRFERIRVRKAAGDLPSDHGVRQDDRRERSRAAAAFVRQQVSAPMPFVIAIDRAASFRMQAARDALLSLVAIAGGRSHRLSSETAARLFRFLEAGEPGRMTAGGAVADMRRGVVYLYRERRGLAASRIEAGQCAIWDGRMEFRNTSGAAIVAGPADERAVAAMINATNCPDVPLGVVRRAMVAEPVIGCEATGVQSMPAREAVEHSLVTMTRRLAPFDLFLPEFDIELANACADLLGRKPYPPIPADFRQNDLTQAGSPPWQGSRGNLC